MSIPRATARLQFHPEFTLDDATRRVPYYADLGVSHLYASPLATARPGSTHGYDVIDHTQINPALGGEPALEKLVHTLRAHDMGLILDIVPNHMATHAENRWWWSVWEHGPDSPYAHYFDIDWNSRDSALTGKILAPFLGKPYGQALEDGDLRLDYDTDRNAFIIRAHDNPYPVAAGTLNDGGQPAPKVIAAHDPTDTEGRARLHALLEQQFYRLAWWRCAPEEINWRRFFEVSELAGVCVERDDVFDAVHALTFDLYARGLIDGVRVDHVDGVADPIGYCAKLRERLLALTSQRPGELARDEPYVIIEKILANDETLDARWQVHGTTGYEFMSQVNAALHDREAEEPLTDLWKTLSGEMRSPEQVLLDARELMIARHFPVERNATVDALHRIARADLHTRDMTRESIRRALHELLRVFPVYRTYADERGRANEDAPRFAATLARAHRPLIDESDGDDTHVLQALDKWLGGEAPQNFPDEQRALRLHAIRRFQQLTPPLAAKSLEDTTFYQYGRLLSTNDVGGEPAVFAALPEEFHAQNAWRAEHRPSTMLTTATHDHKRGEDLRARLSVVTEMPQRWRNVVLRIQARDAFLETWPCAPSGRDRYALWQTIVGAWPPGLALTDADGIAAFRERLGQWQEKSIREAKLSTSWIVADEAYEKACSDYLDHIMAPGNDTLSELAMFARDIAPAGAINGLAQTLLRLTAPGIPDLYQGTEYWDFSLVDPDNRRPVDFDAREKSLATLADASAQALLSTWRDGHIKQAVVARTLALRREKEAVFGRGSYEPLAVSGSQAERVFAYIRQFEGDAVLVVVPRLAGLGIDHTTPDLPVPQIDPGFWGDTTIALPVAHGSRSHVDVLARRDVHVPADGVVNVSELLAIWPVALVALQ